MQLFSNNGLYILITTENVLTTEVKGLYHINTTAMFAVYFYME